MAGAFLGMGIGGGILGGILAYKDTKEQARMMKANAAMAAREAQREKDVAFEKAREKRREQERLKSRQIVLMAKSGLHPTSKTFQLVTAKSKELMERQMRIVTEQGTFAYNQKMAESAMYRRQAKYLSQTALWRAGTALASSLGSAGMSYMAQTAQPRTMPLQTSIANQWMSEPLGLSW